jgi:2-amino-4-hydroxy-6-hydroxymethyldihydropteridine diphosphokinase
LKAILQIEKKMGRLRNKNGYESRIIDIDILYFNDENIHQPDLIIPHPRLHQRRFTLLPLTEIAGDLMHPVYHEKNSELLKRCRDKSFVWRIDGKSNEI